MIGGPKSREVDVDLPREFAVDRDRPAKVNEALHAGVVDDGVEVRVLARQSFAERRDVCHVRHVHDFDADARVPVGDLSQCLEVTTDEDHQTATPREFEPEAAADAGIAAREQDFSRNVICHGSHSGKGAKNFTTFASASAAGSLVPRESPRRNVARTDAIRLRREMVESIDNGVHTPVRSHKRDSLVDHATWDRVRRSLGSKTYKYSQLPYVGSLIRCARRQPDQRRRGPQVVGRRAVRLRPL